MIFSHIEFYEGFAVSLSLIISIGMQNAFILKQGLLKNHITAAVITCTICDGILIIIGVNELGKVLSSNEQVKSIAKIIGSIYLIYFGTKSFLNAFKKNSLKVESNKHQLSLSKVILTSLTVSLFNPHAFLDTCLFLSSVAINIIEEKRIFFISGAIIASFSCFFCIGYGARYLRRFFEKSLSWKILDIIIGILMYITVILLLTQS